MAPLQLLQGAGNDNVLVLARRHIAKLYNYGVRLRTKCNAKAGGLNQCHM